MLDGWFVMTLPVELRQGRFLFMVKRCIGNSGRAMDCKGVMRYRYNDKQLYNQLLYFQSIFDVDKTKRGELRPLVDALEDLRQTVA